MEKCGRVRSGSWQGEELCSGRKSEWEGSLQELVRAN